MKQFLSVSLLNVIVTVVLRLYTMENSEIGLGRCLHAVVVLGQLSLLWSL